MYYYIDEFRVNMKLSKTIHDHNWLEVLTMC